MNTPFEFKDELLEKKFIGISKFLDDSRQNLDKSVWEDIYSLYNYFTGFNEEVSNCPSCRIKIKKFLLIKIKLYKSWVAEVH